MPIEQLAYSGQNGIGLDWPAFVLDLVQQANNVTAANIVDVRRPKLGIARF